MQIAARMGGLALPSSGEWKQLRNWMVAWLLIANAPFMLLWLIGCPPRATEIMAIAGAGLLVRWASYPLRLTTFLFMFGYALIRFTCNLFDVSFDSFIGSVMMVGALSPWASLEYVVGGAAVVATMAFGGWWLRRDANFRSPILHLVAFACAGLLASVDTAATWHTRGSYKKAAPGDSAFGSGVTHSGLLQAAAERRHIMIVVVEALGQPTDPAAAALLMKPWLDPRIRGRYEVSHGTTPYFGSTTTAEIRELCGRWGNYDSVMAKADPSCLPFRLRQQGYRTTGLHSFSGGMFQRTTWYPNVGFERMLFADQLREKGVGECRGVFVGACDREVPRLLASELKAAREPQLLYWLTVNSHMPVIEDASIRTERCDTYSPALATNYPMACRLLRIYDDVARAMVPGITAKDFPPTDILLVGDHMPPFFDRWNRSQFDAHRVPWILLRHKHR